MLDDCQKTIFFSNSYGFLYYLFGFLICLLTTVTFCLHFYDLCSYLIFIKQDFVIFYLFRLRYFITIDLIDICLILEIFLNYDLSSEIEAMLSSSLGFLFIYYALRALVIDWLMISQAKICFDLVLFYFNF